MIIMSSKPQIITQVLKKTTTRFFKNLKVGDMITFEMPIRPSGTGRSGIYASYITVTNIKTKEQNKFSFNQLDAPLKMFELKEVASV